MASELPLTFNRALYLNLGTSTRTYSLLYPQKPSVASPNSVRDPLRTSVKPLTALTTFAVEVAIHTILYVRQVYPPELFVRRRKYDTPVFQSRHPDLNEYIATAVNSISEELALVCSSWCYMFQQLTDPGAR